MDALEALRTRRSIRLFEDKAVGRELVETVIDCGRLAASAGNMQPWEFLAVTDADTRQKIARVATYGHHVAQAPVCILVYGRGSTHDVEDGSAATQNILVAARACGLGSCWIAGVGTGYGDRVSSFVNAPKDYRLVSIIALGWPAKEVPVPPKRSLDQVLRWEKF